MARSAVPLTHFDLEPGRRIAGKYTVETRLGGGLQGEVYRVTELQTGIHRAAKLFYPQGNENNTVARRYAQRLDRLRDCPIVLQYHHGETLRLRGQEVTCLISDFVDGPLLSEYIAAHPGGRVPPFKALHLLYPLVRGLDQIHGLHEYHGDIHAENILVQPRGIFFAVKLVDFFHHGRSSSAQRHADIVDLIHLLYEMTGGKRYYARQPEPVKAICRGLRRDLIVKAFPTAGHLRRHLETFPALSEV